MQSPPDSPRLLVESPSPDGGLFPSHKLEETEATLFSNETNQATSDIPESHSRNYYHAEPQIFTKVPRREATVSGTDPTCLPPITVTRSRTLILCFDGTGDQFDNDNSNIVNIFSFLKKDDKNVQMCYYQAGIGTWSPRHFSIPGAMTISQKLDQAVAWALKDHVQDGYEFLMQNYVVGDKVCLFGFSRGAYTARALAGMLHKVGLLTAGNKQQIPFAWQMFKDVTEQGWKMSRQFKKSFSVDVNIDFMGVFDTVSSVGIIGRKLPFTASNFSIRYFRHAMALDERRAKFKVNHWTHTQPTDEHHDKKKKKSVRKGHEHLWKEEDDVETDVKEVWFSGCHADVGGGSVANETPNSLARIPLRWMIRETFRCNTGILWDIDCLKTVGLDPDLLYPKVVIPTIESNGSVSIPSTSKCEGISIPSQDDTETLDALSPIYDQLTLAPGWWILEFIPTKGRRQLPPPANFDTWKSYFFVNVGKGRIIPRHKEGANFHSSVKKRRDEGKYKWKAIGEVEPTWVD